VGTQSVKTNTLERYRTTYEATTARITSEIQQQRADALVQYGKLLDTAMTILKQKGDIDAYGVVSAEAKRFATDKTVLTNSTEPYISAAVNRYQKQLTEADAELSRRQTALLKQYIGALNGLVRELMAKDKIDDAKAVGNQRNVAEALLKSFEGEPPKVNPSPIATPEQPKISPVSVTLTETTKSPDVAQPATTSAIPDSVTSSQPINTPDQPPKKDVPPDTVEFNKHKYMLLGVATWTEAKEHCEELGGHLVTINSSAEWNFIKQQYKKWGVSGIWLGAKVEKDSPWFSSRNFTWVTGEPFSYQAWAPNGLIDARHVNLLACFTHEGITAWHNVQEGDARIDAYVCEWDSDAKQQPAQASQPVVGASPVGNTVYLSDLHETSVSGCTSYGLVKGRLDTWTVNGKIPRHGILACAPSSVVYDIGNLKMTTLEGSVGIGRVNVNSSVKFRIHGDDKLLWESDELRQGPKQGVSPDIKFSVNITGISRVELEVDPLGGVNSDHSIWIDPRLTRQR
jgi:hypothetical protein